MSVQLLVPCRELLALSDGGEVALDWAEPEGGGAGEWSHAPPIMLILTGLSGWCAHTHRLNESTVYTCTCTCGCANDNIRKVYSHVWQAQARARCQEDKIFEHLELTLLIVSCEWGGIRRRL